MVHTHNWQFHWQAALGRTRWPKHSQGRGFLGQDQGWSLQPFPYQHDRCFCFCEELNCERSDQCWARGPQSFFFLIPTSLVTISVNLFCHIQNVLLVTWKSIPLQWMKESWENKLPFHTAHSCFPFAAVSFFSLRWQLVIRSICYLSYLSCTAKLAQVLKSLASTKI